MVCSGRDYLIPVIANEDLIVLGDEARWFEVALCYVKEVRKRCQEQGPFSERILYCRGRSRATTRYERTAIIKENFSFACGQIDFEGKLLQDIDGWFEKVNRLAVVAFQDDENQLLCITKTKDATGKVEVDAVKEAIMWELGVVRVKL